MNPDEFNARLATACQQKAAACCKKGWLFLSPAERATIERHVAAQGPTAAAEFAARMQAHDGFSLYDQRDRCQFLTDDNLCALHSLGIKPNECFWWPYHVYTEASGRLMIEISTTCCDACLYHDEVAAAQFLDAIDEQVAGLGPEVIRRFRAAYGGSYGRRPVRPVRDLRFAFLTVANLSVYRRLGERFFPQANWDLGMQRYAAMLPAFGEGVLGAWLGDRLVGYAALWPVNERFEARFTSGRAGDHELDDTQLAPPGTPGGGRSWLLTAIAMDTSNVLLRHRVRQQLEEHIRGALQHAPDARVFAEAVTESGERFLRRVGFHFVFPAAPRVCVLRH